MTDTNELRAAVKRLSIEAYNSVEHAKMYEQPLRRALDAIVLARAYIAKHFAGDGEPVTHERLRNVGFTRGMQSASSKVLTLWSGKNYVSVDIEKDGFVRVAIGDSDVAEYLPAGFSMQTMGDVRRLCEALGIELKESKS